MIIIRCTRSRGPRGFFCLQDVRRGPVNVAVITLHLIYFRHTKIITFAARISSQNLQVWQYSDAQSSCFLVRNWRMGDGMACNQGFAPHQRAPALRWTVTPSATVNCAAAINSLGDRYQHAVLSVWYNCNRGSLRWVGSFYVWRHVPPGFAGLRLALVLIADNNTMNRSAVLRGIRMDCSITALRLSKTLSDKSERGL